jgi:hypothetical protein
MAQYETVALETDGQQVMAPRGAVAISPEVAIKEARRCLRCVYREEEV